MGCSACIQLASEVLDLTSYRFQEHLRGIAQERRFLWIIIRCQADFFESSQTKMLCTMAFTIAGARPFQGNGSTRGVPRIKESEMCKTREFKVHSSQRRDSLRYTF